MPERRQTPRVSLAAYDRPQDLLSGLAHDVGEYRVQPDVHLGQRLLHVLHTTRVVLDQPLRLAHVGAKRAHRIPGAKRAPQKP